MTLLTPLGRPWFRLLLTLTLTVATACAGLAFPQQARADEVAVAQARVDKLQDLVKDTTRTLTVGTQRWEADQVRLRQVQVALGNTQRRVRAAAQVAADGEARVAAIARRLYMNPGGTGLQLAFTRGRDEMLESLQVRESLNQVTGSDGQIIARANTARHRQKQQEAAALQLERDARELVDRSATRLRELNALAQSTADKLVAAENALQRARAAKAARLAAAAARAAKARASRARYSFAGGPACTGKSTEGQQNGNLDPASLCPLWMAPGHRLRSDAAAAFNKMSKYHAAVRGAPLCVTDSYRSYSEQASLYRRKPGLAAVPGSSEHGWGKAVDLCGGVQNSGSAAYQWMKANAGRFGWFHPDWAEPGGSKPEAWHWEFRG